MVWYVSNKATIEHSFWFLVATNNTPDNYTEVVGHTLSGKLNVLFLISVETMEWYPGPSGKLIYLCEYTQTGEILPYSERCLCNGESRHASFSFNCTFC